MQVFIRSCGTEGNAIIAMVVDTDVNLESTCVVNEGQAYLFNLFRVCPIEVLPAGSSDVVQRYMGKVYFSLNDETFEQARQIFFHEITIREEVARDDFQKVESLLTFRKAYLSRVNLDANEDYVVRALEPTYYNLREVYSRAFNLARNLRYFSPDRNITIFN